MTPQQKPPTPEEMQAAREALRESTAEMASAAIGRDAAQEAVKVVRRWQAERAEWASSGPRNGFPPSWPLSFVDTAKLIIDLADRTEQGEAWKRHAQTSDRELAQLRGQRG